jgi:hypothetical protein
MSKVEEIERLIEQLPVSRFRELAAWLEQRMRQEQVGERPTPLRNHSAFLNSYATSDEGLYDDAIAR